jgi:hypothetical protein
MAICIAIEQRAIFRAALPAALYEGRVAFSFEGLPFPFIHGHCCFLLKKSKYFLQKLYAPTDIE